MTSLDLRSFATRSRTLVDASPPTTRRETRTWLVDPLLETLGWDVHADACRTDVSIEEIRLEYVLSIESIPSLFVAVEPYERSLNESRAMALLEAMAWTGVDRAIYTDGHDVLLLAGTTNVDRFAFRLSSIPEHESSVEHYSRKTIRGRLEHETRSAVARQLALEQAPITESIADRLSMAVENGDDYAIEFESAAERFLDRLIVSFANDDIRLESGSEDVSLQFTDETGSCEPSDTDVENPIVDHSYSNTDRQDADGSSNETATEDVSTPDVETEPDENPHRESVSAGESEPQEVERDGDGEYVVRFFNERGSIGAVGHSRSEQALIQATEYLFERGLSGIRTPWSPDEDRTVLNDEPQRADGSEMAANQQLSNGLYLDIGGNREDHAARVEALAARAGLRAMLTGDWGE
ncbi:hypothetical protein ACLI4Z_11660 [Natrialbaceae archaeon A-arb3/5]